MYYGPNPYSYPQFGNMYMPGYGHGAHHYYDVNPYGNAHGFDPWQEQFLEYEDRMSRRDYGKRPYVVNIEEATKQNRNFRTALWTGNHLQVTLMSIGVGEDIGLEIHRDVDQFLRIEEGQGVVQMGRRRDRLDFRQRVRDDDAIMVPAGTWHNVINTGNRPLKLYSIYAPPEHPFGTVHRTKAEAMAAESGRG